MRLKRGNSNIKRGDRCWWAHTRPNPPTSHDDSASFPERSPLTDNLYVEEKVGALHGRRVRGGERGKKQPPRQGQGRDTSGRGSYLQSAASLISDKDIVNQGSQEVYVWALCPQTDGRTDRVSTSVSHFARTYRICSKVPPLIIMVSAEIPTQDLDFYLYVAHVCELCLLLFFNLLSM